MGKLSWFSVILKIWLHMLFPIPEFDPVVNALQPYRIMLFIGISGGFPAETFGRILFKDFPHVPDAAVL